MKKKISLLLVIIMVLVFSLHSYAVNSEAPHIYHKYTIKTWWDKNNNNGLYSKKPIYINQLERVPYFGGTKTMYVNYRRFSGYRGYEFVPISVNGYTSYEMRGINLFTVKLNNEYLSVSKHDFDRDGNLTYAYTKYKFIKEEPWLNNKWALTSQQLERYVLKLNYYIYEHKDKDIFLNEIIAPKGTFPSNGLHTDGYWYVDTGVLNKIPELSITQPIANQRIGTQDNLIVNGCVKDKDVGDTLTIKYSINNAVSSNITLTQPTSLISNGQAQSFKGHIKLNGISSGSHILKLWVEDSKGAKSNIVEVPIIIFNTLENILNSLKSYTYRSGEPQLLVINCNSVITQNAINDSLISQIKSELEAKNVKLFFIGENGSTESYIRTKLFLN